MICIRLNGRALHCIANPSGRAFYCIAVPSGALHKFSIWACTPLLCPAPSYPKSKNETKKRWTPLRVSQEQACSWEGHTHEPSALSLGNSCTGQLNYHCCSGKAALVAPGTHLSHDQSSARHMPMHTTTSQRARLGNSHHARAYPHKHQGGADLPVILPAQASASEPLECAVQGEGACQEQVSNIDR